MAISKKLLGEGEQVVVSTRTHVKALLVPALVLILIAGAAGFLSTLPGGTLRALLQWVVWGIALVLIAIFVLRPFLDWLTSTYVVTNRRLMTQTGILAKKGHNIGLNRINDVTYEFGIVDRVLGCGTLIFSVASEGRVRLHDIPNVAQVHLTIHELLHDLSTGQPHRQADDGT